MPVARVGASGDVTPITEAPPVWSRVKAVHYVCGKTLDRVALIHPRTPAGHRNRIDAICHKVSDRQRRIGCDMCPKTHRLTNVTCSANLGLHTYATKDGHLYDIHTRADLGKWNMSATFWKTSRTALASFTR
jgi:hypothetical protein